MMHIIKRTAVILAAAAVCLSFTSCFELAYGLYDLGKDIAEEGERHTEFLEKQKVKERHSSRITAPLSGIKPPRSTAAARRLQT